MSRHALDLWGHLSDYERLFPSGGEHGWAIDLSDERIAQDIEGDPCLELMLDNRRPSPIVRPGDAYRVAEVISPHAPKHGRGYLVVGKRAYLRSPCWTGGWTAMDRAVATALGVTVAAYVVTGQGVVSFPLPAEDVPLAKRMGGTGGEA